MDPFTLSPLDSFSNEQKVTLSFNGREIEYHLLSLFRWVEQNEEKCPLTRYMFTRSQKHKVRTRALQLIRSHADYQVLNDMRKAPIYNLLPSNRGDDLVSVNPGFWKTSFFVVNVFLYSIPDIHILEIRNVVHTSNRIANYGAVGIITYNMVLVVPFIIFLLCSLCSIMPRPIKILVVGVSIYTLLRLFLV